MNATANDWTQIEPLLDDAMAALDETDRAAILLRYFENKNLREVGESLKISDDAAQKRVSRAVERLREFFSKQKIAIGAGGLAVLISANAVQSAPVGLAATISAAWRGCACMKAVASVSARRQASHFNRNCRNQNHRHDHNTKNRDCDSICRDNWNWNF